MGETSMNEVQLDSDTIERLKALENLEYMETVDGVTLFDAKDGITQEWLENAIEELFGELKQEGYKLLKFGEGDESLYDLHSYRKNLGIVVGVVIVDQDMADKESELEVDE